MNLCAAQFANLGFPTFEKMEPTIHQCQTDKNICMGILELMAKLIVVKNEPQTP